MYKTLTAILVTTVLTGCGDDTPLHEPSTPSPDYPTNESPVIDTGLIVPVERMPKVIGDGIERGMPIYDDVTPIKLISPIGDDAEHMPKPIGDGNPDNYPIYDDVAPIKLIDPIGNDLENGIPVHKDYGNIAKTAAKVYQMLNRDTLDPVGGDLERPMPIEDDTTDNLDDLPSITPRPTCVDDTVIEDTSYYSGYLTQIVTTNTCNDVREVISTNNLVHQVSSINGSGQVLQSVQYYDVQEWMSFTEYNPDTGIYSSYYRDYTTGKTKVDVTDTSTYKVISSQLLDEGTVEYTEYMQKVTALVDQALLVTDHSLYDSYEQEYEKYRQ